MYLRLTGILSALTAALICAPPATALCGEVCEVSIRPGVLSVPLPLEGWIYDEANNITDVRVIDEPRFGTWINEVYTPNPDFWQAGGDSLRLMVGDGERSVLTSHTIVFKVASDALRYDEAEDFEGSGGSLNGLGADWLILDPTYMSITPEALLGAWSLDVQFDAGSSPTNSVQGPFEELRNGLDQMGGTVVINASPPDEPWIGFENLFGLTVIELGDLAAAELRYENEQYELRTVITNMDCSVCATPWQPIEMGADYRIRLWLGRQALQHPSNESWSLEMKVAKLDGTWQAEEQLLDLELLDYSQPPELTPTMGAFGGWGHGRARIRVDQLESWRGKLGEALMGNQVEEFVDGVWSNSWIGVGSIGSALAPDWKTSIALLDDWMGEIQLDDVKNSGSDAHWLDLTPNDSGTFWGHMKLQLGPFALGKWGSIVLLDGQNANGASFLHVLVRANGTLDLQILARVRDGSGHFKGTGWTDAGDGSLPLDVAWNGAAGTLDMWIGDVHLERHDLVPSSYSLDRVAVGMRILGLGTGTVPDKSRLLIDNIVLAHE